MVTLIPELVLTASGQPSFTDSVRLSMQRLDDHRLLRQMLDVHFVISNAEPRVDKDRIAWMRFADVREMWRGYDMALRYYYNICLSEALRRRPDLTFEHIDYGAGEKFTVPHWLGNEKLHNSHKQSLLYESAVELHILTSAAERMERGYYVQRAVRQPWTTETINAALDRAERNFYHYRKFKWPDYLEPSPDDVVVGSYYRGFYWPEGKKKK